MKKVKDKIINEEFEKKAKAVTKKVISKLKEQEEESKLDYDKMFDEFISDTEKDELEEFVNVAKERKKLRKSRKNQKKMNESRKFYSIPQIAEKHGIDFMVAADKFFKGVNIEHKNNKNLTEGTDDNNFKIYDEISVKLYENINAYDKLKKVVFTETELVDFIERLVNEQKVQGKTQEKKSMKTSKEENEKNIKAVTKKMKEYLKDGSTDEYDDNPEDFPKGNRDMDKTAYVPSDGIEEYIEHIARSGGMENLDYDEIKPNDEWIDKNIEGSPETGNDPEWANAVKTDVGKKVKDRKDKNYLAKLKKQSYNKAPQPVTDYAGNKTSDEKLGDIDLNEGVSDDILKIKKLYNFNYKSQ